MCVKLNSLFDRQTKVYYVTQVFKDVTSKECVLTTYPNLEAQTRIYCKSIYACRPR